MFSLGFLLAGLFAAAWANPIAKTDCGLVSGTIDPATGLSAFYGIPYGAPPLGPTGRWKPPKSAQCWPSGQTFNAEAPGKICWQIDALVPCATVREQSEDCLNLDVFTYNPSGNASLPVMVWIYGGSLVYGYSDWYANLTTLARSGRIVLVAINYRLNSFGYLAHKALGSVDPRGVSGNYGVLDQQLALQWVKANIANFGGNPDSVTLIGQSSGGTSIFALLSSPSSIGLFHGAISLSASPNMTIDLLSAYSQNEAVVYHVCPHNETSELLQCLYALDAVKVATMLPESYQNAPFLPVSPSGQFYPGLPIIDGVTLTQDLMTSVRTGVVDVPLLVQTMQCELDTLSSNKTIDSMTPSQYKEFLTTYFDQRGWPQGAGATLYNLYSTQAAVSVELAYQQWYAEFSFLCGNIEVAVNAAQGFSSPVYLSLIARGPDNPLHIIPFTPPAHYAGHLWDYIAATQAWSWFHECALEAAYQPTAGDIAFGEVLLEQWLTFAELHSLPAALGLQTVNSSPSFPTNYNLALQNGTQPLMVESYAAPRCNAFLQPPLNLNQSFWIVN